MEYREREAMKHDAWQLFSKPDATTAEKIDALLMVAEAHFWSSVPLSSRKHPDLSEFTCHWVWATMSGYGSSHDAAACAEMKRRYPRPKVLKIAEGHSTWGIARPEKSLRDELGTAVIPLTLANKGRNRHGKRMKYHLLDHRAMCAEAVEVQYERRSDALLDVGRWDETDAITSASEPLYYDWRDVCHFCLCNLRRALRHELLKARAAVGVG